MKYRVSREKYRQESSERFYRNDYSLMPLVVGLAVLMFACTWVKSTQPLTFKPVDGATQRTVTVIGH